VTRSPRLGGLAVSSDWRGYGISKQLQPVRSKVHEWPLRRSRRLERLRFFTDTAILARALSEGRSPVHGSPSRSHVRRGHGCLVVADVGVALVIRMRRLSR